MNNIFFVLIAFLSCNCLSELVAQTQINSKGTFYINAKLAKKNFLHSDQLTRTLSPNDRGYYGGSGIGYYVSKAIAIETGLEYYSYYFFTPFDISDDPDYDAMRYSVMSIPASIRYDFYSKPKFNVYAKYSIGIDYRLSLNEAYNGDLPNPNNATRDASENTTTLSTGIEAGFDYRILENIRLGTFINLNYASSDSATLQYEKLNINQESFTEQLRLNNTHFGFGLELKLDI